MDVAGGEEWIRLFDPLRSYQYIIHTLAIVEVRLHLEARFHGDGKWITEQELLWRVAKDGKVRDVKVPDGVVVQGGRKVAVEVEMNWKNRHKYSKIIEKYIFSDYHKVLFFTKHEGVGRVIQGEIEKAAVEDRMRVIPCPGLPFVISLQGGEDYEAIEGGGSG